MVKDGRAELIGSIQGVTASESNAIATIDTLYAPKQDVVLPCVAGTASSADMAKVLITTAGKVMIPYIGGASGQCGLNGVAWHIGE